jgi:hypothetical protein
MRLASLLPKIVSRSLWRVMCMVSVELTPRLNMGVTPPAAENQVHTVRFIVIQALWTAQEWSVLMGNGFSLQGQKVIRQLGGDPQVRLDPSPETRRAQGHCSTKLVEILVCTSFKTWRPPLVLSHQSLIPFPPVISLLPWTGVLSPVLLCAWCPS